MRNNELVKINGEKLNESVNEASEIYELCKQIKKRIGTSFGFKECFYDIEKIYEDIKKLNEDYENTTDKIKSTISSSTLVEGEEARTLIITDDESNIALDNNLDKTSSFANEESESSSFKGDKESIEDTNSDLLSKNNNSTSINQYDNVNADGSFFYGTNGDANANSNIYETQGAPNDNPNLGDKKEEKASVLAKSLSTMMASVAAGSNLQMADIETELNNNEIGLNIDIDNGIVNFNGEQVDSWNDLVSIIEEYGDPMLKTYIYQKEDGKDYQAFAKIIRDNSRNFDKINSYDLTKGLCDSGIFSFNIFNEHSLTEMLGSDITLFQAGTNEEQYNVLNQFSLAMIQPDVKTQETLALAYLILEHPNIAKKIDYDHENARSDYTVRTDYHLELNKQYINSQSDLELLEAYYAKDIYGEVIRETAFEIFLCSKEEIENENNYEMNSFGLGFQGQKITVTYNYSQEEFIFYSDGKAIDVSDDYDLREISEWLKLDKTTLSEEEFEEQMEILKNNKYCLGLTNTHSFLDRAVVVDLAENAKMQRKYGFYYDAATTIDANSQYNLFSSLKMLEMGYCVNSETKETVTSEDIDNIIELLGYKEYEKAFEELDKIKFANIGPLYNKTASDYLGERGFTAKKVEKIQSEKQNKNIDIEEQVDTPINKESSDNILVKGSASSVQAVAYLSGGIIGGVENFADFAIGMLGTGVYGLSELGMRGYQAIFYEDLETIREAYNDSLTKVSELYEQGYFFDTHTEDVLLNDIFGIYFSDEFYKCFRGLGENIIEVKKDENGKIIEYSYSDGFRERLDHYNGNLLTLFNNNLGGFEIHRESINKFLLDKFSNTSSYETIDAMWSLIVSENDSPYEFNKYGNKDVSSKSIEQFANALNELEYTDETLKKLIEIEVLGDYEIEICTSPQETEMTKLSQLVFQIAYNDCLNSEMLEYTKLLKQNKVDNGKYYYDENGVEQPYTEYHYFVLALDIINSTNWKNTIRQSIEDDSLLIKDSKKAYEEFGQGDALWLRKSLDKIEEITADIVGFDVSGKYISLFDGLDKYGTLDDDVKVFGVNLSPKEIITSVGEMIPTIVLMAATGGSSSVASFGSSAIIFSNAMGKTFESTYQDPLFSNKNLYDRFLYSMAIAGLETAIESTDIFGAGFGGISSSNVLKKVNKGKVKVLGEAVFSLFKSSTEEGIEEILSGAFSPYISYFLVHKNEALLMNELNEFYFEGGIWEDGLSGCFSATIMNFSGLGIGTQKLGELINKSIDENSFRKNVREYYDDSFGLTESEWLDCATDVYRMMTKEKTSETDTLSIKDFLETNSELIKQKMHTLDKMVALEVQDVVSGYEIGDDIGKLYKSLSLDVRINVTLSEFASMIMNRSIIEEISIEEEVSDIETEEISETMDDGMVEEVSDDLDTTIRSDIEIEEISKNMDDSVVEEISEVDLELPDFEIVNFDDIDLSTEIPFSFYNQISENKKDRYLTIADKLSKSDLEIKELTFHSKFNSLRISSQSKNITIDESVILDFDVNETLLLIKSIWNRISSRADITFNEENLILEFDGLANYSLNRAKFTANPDIYIKAVNTIKDFKHYRPKKVSIDVNHNNIDITLDDKKFKFETVDMLSEDMVIESLVQDTLNASQQLRTLIDNAFKKLKSRRIGKYLQEYVYNNIWSVKDYDTEELYFFLNSKIKKRLTYEQFVDLVQENLGEINSFLNKLATNLNLVFDHFQVMNPTLNNLLEGLENLLTERVIPSTGIFYDRLYYLAGIHSNILESIMEQNKFLDYKFENGLSISAHGTNFEILSKMVILLRRAVPKANSQLLKVFNLAGYTLELHDSDRSRWLKAALNYYSDSPFEKFYSNGNANTDTKKIVLYPNDNYVELLNTLHHELAHVIDKTIENFLPELGTISSSPLWRDAMDADFVLSGKKSITDYGTTNNAEDFAECVEAYLANPTDFQTVFPNRARILSDLLLVISAINGTNGLFEQSVLLDIYPKIQNDTLQYEIKRIIDNSETVIGDVKIESSDEVSSLTNVSIDTHLENQDFYKVTSETSETTSTSVVSERPGIFANLLSRMNGLNVLATTNPMLFNTISNIVEIATLTGILLVFAPSLTTLVVPGIYSLILLFQSNIINNAISTIIIHIENFVNNLQTFIKSITNGIKGTFNSITNFFNTKIIKNSLVVIKILLKSILSFVGLTILFSPLETFIGQSYLTNAKLLISSFVALSSIIDALITIILNQVKSILAGGISKVKDLFNSLISPIKNMFNNSTAVSDSTKIFGKRNIFEGINKNFIKIFSALFKLSLVFGVSYLISSAVLSIQSIESIVNVLESIVVNLRGKIPLYISIGFTAIASLGKVVSIVWNLALVCGKLLNNLVKTISSFLGNLIAKIMPSSSLLKGLYVLTLPIIASMLLLLFNVDIGISVVVTGAYVLYRLGKGLFTKTFKKINDMSLSLGKLINSWTKFIIVTLIPLGLFGVMDYVNLLNEEVLYGVPIATFFLGLRIALRKNSNKVKAGKIVDEIQTNYEDKVTDKPKKNDETKIVDESKKIDKTKVDKTKLPKINLNKFAIRASLITIIVSIITFPIFVYVFDDKEEDFYLKLYGKTNIDLLLGDTYSEPGYYAYDSIDGDITSKVLVDGAVNSSKVGSYILTYTITNSRNKTIEKARVINVVDNTMIDADENGLGIKENQKTYYDNEPIDYTMFEITIDNFNEQIEKGKIHDGIDVSTSSLLNQYMNKLMLQNRLLYAISLTSIVKEDNQYSAIYDCDSNYLNTEASSIILTNGTIERIYNKNNNCFDNYGIFYFTDHKLNFIRSVNEEISNQLINNKIRNTFVYQDVIVDNNAIINNSETVTKNNALCQSGPNTLKVFSFDEVISYSNLGGIMLEENCNTGILLTDSNAVLSKSQYSSIINIQHASDTNGDSIIFFHTKK